MAIQCSTVETICVKWQNIELPRPYQNCKSSIFSLDGFDWYAKVHCFWKGFKDKYGNSVTLYESWKFSIECSNILASSDPYIIIPYVSTDEKYIRLAPNIHINFTRQTLSETGGLEGDCITMLFLIVKDSLDIDDIFNENATENKSWNERIQPLCLENLLEDMNQLFNEKKLTDVTLKCGNSSFPAHRNILAARSDVFSAMFDHDMSEKSSGVVEIVDMDATILEQFVKYLYTGIVDEMSIDTSKELYQAADKYAVYSLKNLCVSHILSNMTKDIVCEMLLLADRTGDMEFLDGIASFAAADGEFLKTAEWKDFALKNGSAAIRVCLMFINKSH